MIKLHRTPYGGRNFEYYSEDSVLSSEIGKAEEKGVMGGTTAFDSMLIFMLTGKDAFPAYANDPAAINAMREASHHNLYAIAKGMLLEEAMETWK